MLRPGQPGPQPQPEKSLKPGSARNSMKSKQLGILIRPGVMDFRFFRGIYSSPAMACLGDATKSVHCCTAVVCMSSPVTLCNQESLGSEKNGTVYKRHSDEQSKSRSPEFGRQIKFKNAWDQRTNVMKRHIKIQKQNIYIYIY